jgi:hypothetical protein
MMQPERNHSAASINPFRPGMGLDPPYLGDRTAQLGRFDQYLSGFPAFPVVRLGDIVVAQGAHIARVYPRPENATNHPDRKSHSGSPANVQQMVC